MGIKVFIKYCHYYSGMSSASRIVKKRPKVWILSYHSVNDHQGREFQYIAPSLTVPPGVFENHIAFLSRNYKVISLDDVVGWIAGTTALPEGGVIITFDDGYRDNYLYAYPILKKYSVPATFYVVTDTIGNAHPLWTSEVRNFVYRVRRREITLSCLGSQHLDLSDETAKHQAIKTIGRVMRCADKITRREILWEIQKKLDGKETDPLRGVMMSWDELREMKHGGMNIGSHTISHPLLPEISEEEAAVEIRGSKAKIEEELDAPAAHFAYPNPGGSVHVNEQVKALVRDAGYLTARKVFKGSVDQDSDPFELNGIPITNSCSHVAFLDWILN